MTQKRIKLTNQITADLPSVNADINQLWRVFSTLIGNVLKHNPDEIQLTLAAQVVKPGQKVVKVREWGNKKFVSVKLLVPPQAPMLLCTVQDSGAGIAPEQSQRLFKLYTRGAQAQYMPGLGLGLYLCQQIIQAHRGEIGVTSTLNEGSTFWFTLPLRT
ncbi:MAG: HAMP domain-containing histidine kinase [Cyanothece sp. SIO1E1]|nr:HAMP domain-containing histidine kinase [Cyanothece sp. SIO1E1]